MEKTKVFLFYLFLILFLATPAAAVTDDSAPYTWEIGEDLLYKVKWSFINLGTIRVQVVDTTRVDNILNYITRVIITSNPSLPFVNFYSELDAYLDADFNVYRVFGTEKIDGINYDADYRFNYADSTIRFIYTDPEDPTNVRDEIQPIDTRLIDGLGMVFYARGNCHRSDLDTITTFYNARRGKVDFDFTGRSERIGIDVFEYKPKGHYIRGNVHMKGMAGLSGPFEGWFATDNRRPPLKARLKVFIGSVTLELIDWKTWKAPLPRKSETN